MTVISNAAIQRESKTKVTTEETLAHLLGSAYLYLKICLVADGGSEVSFPSERLFTVKTVDKSDNATTRRASAPCPCSTSNSPLWITHFDIKASKGWGYEVY